MTGAMQQRRRRAYGVESYRPASMVQRFGGLLVDGLIFIVSVAVPSLLLLWWAGPEHITFCQFRDGVEDCSMTPEAESFIRRAFYSLSAVFVLIYSVFIARGQTIGKRAASTMVVSASTGEPLGYPRSVARTLLSIVSLIPFGAGFWFALTNRNRRAIHDLIVGSRVISP